MDVLSEQRTYVAGRWITGDEVLSVENPADESHVADVSLTPLEEIERSVIQARRSFDEGSIRMPNHPNLSVCTNEVRPPFLCYSIRLEDDDDRGKLHIAGSQHCW